MNLNKNKWKGRDKRFPCREDWGVFPFSPYAASCYLGHFIPVCLTSGITPNRIFGGLEEQYALEFLWHSLLKRPIALSSWWWSTWQCLQLPSQTLVSGSTLFIRTQGLRNSGRCGDKHMHVTAKMVLCNLAEIPTESNLYPKFYYWSLISSRLQGRGEERRKRDVQGGEGSHGAGRGGLAWQGHFFISSQLSFITWNTIAYPFSKGRGEGTWETVLFCEPKTEGNPGKKEIEGNGNGDRCPNPGISGGTEKRE